MYKVDIILILRFNLEELSVWKKMRKIIISLKYNNENSRLLIEQVKAQELTKGPYKPILGK